VLDREEPVKLARKDAVLWLRNAEPVQVLSAPRSRLAYYAGADRWVPVPAARDPAKFAQQLRASGAEFLIVEEGSVPDEVWEGTLDLRLLHQVAYADGRVLVFQVERTPPSALPRSP
jgi:hypothetical protein